MVVRAKDIIIVLEKNLAPPGLAEDWDNSGWQVGDPGAKVGKVLLALDVTAEVVDEAERIDAQMIISHHPVLLKGIKSVRRDDPAGALLYRLIKTGIGVYSAHTTLDSAAEGVNDALARALGLVETQVLYPKRQQFIKLVVFVPQDYAGEVRQALGRAGAGWIGNYSDCTFNLRGTGTFRPREGTNPFTGTVGELEQVDEVRIETIIEKENIHRVLTAMVEAHPYEEVAYDLYRLENEGASWGLGRMGHLSKPIPLAELAKKIKAVLQADCLRYGGNPDTVISKVAVCGGSGGDLWPLALGKGAEVLVTGDVRYHAARDMLAAGMCFVDAGHFATERIALPALRDNLSEALAATGISVAVVVTDTEREPWQSVL